MIALRIGLATGLGGGRIDEIPCSICMLEDHTTSLNSEFVRAKSKKSCENRKPTCHSTVSTCQRPLIYRALTLIQQTD